MQKGYLEAENRSLSAPVGSAGGISGGLSVWIGPPTAAGDKILYSRRSSATGQQEQDDDNNDGQADCDTFDGPWGHSHHIPVTRERERERCNFGRFLSRGLLPKTPAVKDAAIGSLRRQDDKLGGKAGGHVGE